MACRLIIRQEGSEQILDLRGPRIVLGRGEDCDIPVYDSKSSRRHCEIVQVDGGYKVVDLESRNGTRVNEAVVNQHLLAHGDVIRIGNTTVQFEDPLRDPARRIPGRVQDYRPSEASPIVVQPGSIDLSPKHRPQPPPRPSVSRATERIGSDPADAGRKPEIPAASLGAREEARRAREEQSLIKSFAIIAGVFFGMVVLFVGVSYLSRSSPERRSYERTLADAAGVLAELQGSGPADPRRAIARARDAQRTLGRIPPEPELIARVHSLSKQFEAWILSMQDKMHQEEFQTFEGIWTRAGKARSSAQVEELLKEIVQFRERFPDALPETMKKVEEVEASLIARRGTTHQRDFEEAQERVDAFIKRNAFTLALDEADKMLESFKGDFDLHQRAIALRERVIDGVRVFVEDRRRRAQEYHDRGDREMARHVYDEILKTLGDGRVEAFQGYVEMILRERN